MEEIIVSQKLKSHFLRLYQIALSDNEFSSSEMKMLYDFALERGVNEKDLDQILLSSSKNEQYFPDKIEEKIEYLVDLTQMIWADGKISEDERFALEKYIQLFGFLDENIVPLADFFIDAVKKGRTKDQIINELNS